MFLIENYKNLLSDECQYFYNDIITFFNNIKQFDDIPNIIFYGIPNPLKLCLVNTCLEILTDESINDLTDVVYKISGCGNKIIEEIIPQSNYHIIINPKGNNFDRYLVQNIIKVYAKNKVLDVFNTKLKYKIVVIHNAHKLSHIAQASLRRTMERYNYNCRFIMTCDKLLMKPLQSRCCHLRIPLPSIQNLCKFTYNIALKNHLILSTSELYNIVKICNKNITNILWYIDFVKHNCKYVYNFDTFIDSLYKLILTKSITNIDKIRETFFNISITGYTCELIIKHIILKFINDPNILDHIKIQILNIGLQCEYQFLKGRRGIIHFDNFIINIMFILLKK